MNTLVRIIVTALAVGVAAWLVPGILVSGGDTTSLILTLVGVAVIIGLVNAVVKPIVTAVSGCFIVLTLGLFLLVVNAWMLMLASWLAGQLNLGFHVDGFWPAVFGSIIISLVTALLSGFVPSRRAEQH